jgi:hypothetical protein
MSEWIKVIELRFKDNILDWNILQKAIDNLAAIGGGTICLLPDSPKD